MDDLICAIYDIAPREYKDVSFGLYVGNPITCYHCEAPATQTVTFTCIDDDVMYRNIECCADHAFAHKPEAEAR